MVSTQRPGARPGAGLRLLPVVFVLTLLAAVITATGALGGVGNGIRIGLAGATAAQPRPASQGRFIVMCQPTVRGTIDPVVHPGAGIGSSHEHDFFGPMTIKARAGVADLRKVATSCSTNSDRSAYWAPTVFEHGKRVMPQRVQAYYGVDNLTRPMPAGLRMIVGSPKAAATDGKHVWWDCVGRGTSTRHTTVPSSCMAGGYLMATILFPGCWDGVHKTSSTYLSHVAFANGLGVCPASHPVHIPQLSLFLQWSFANAETSTVRLSSGGTGTLHADFVSGWSLAAQRTLIDRCKAKDCNLQGTLKPSPSKLHPPDLSVL